MTGADIFAAALESARSVSYWRQRAAEAGRREQAGMPRGPYDLTRRQCLARVRYGQARIVDLAIQAELQALRDDRAKSADVCAFARSPAPESKSADVCAFATSPAPGSKSADVCAFRK